MHANESCLESYLLIDCNDFNEHLTKVIKSIDKVEDIESTTGAFDIVTKKTKDYDELQKLMTDDLRKVIDKRTTLILMKKENGLEISSLDEFNKGEMHENFTDCDFCGLTLPHCHCKCPIVVNEINVLVLVGMQLLRVRKFQ